jgi:hypothetical protein
MASAQAHTQCELGVTSTNRETKYDLPVIANYSSGM